MHKEVFVSLATVAIVLATPTADAQTNVSSDPYHLSGGTTASTNATLIKTGNRFFDWLYASNPTATGAFIHMFNSAATPSCSSTVLSINGSSGIVHVFPIPPNFGGFIIAPRLNENYNQGLAFCVTASGADGDVSVSPVGIMVEGGYR